MKQNNVIDVIAFILFLSFKDSFPHQGLQAVETFVYINLCKFILISFTIFLN